MIPIALARSCFCIGIHARLFCCCFFFFGGGVVLVFFCLFFVVWFCFFSVFVLREITSHSGRTLVPEKGQWMSYVGVLSPGAALLRPDGQRS